MWHGERTWECIPLQRDRAKAVPSSNKAKATGKKSKKTTLTSSSPVPCPPSMATIVEEIVVKNGVLKYYITSEAEDGRVEEGGGVFLTQDEGRFSIMYTQ